MSGVGEVYALGAAAFFALNGLFLHRALRERGGSPTAAVLVGTAVQTGVFALVVGLQWWVDAPRRFVWAGLGYSAAAGVFSVYLGRLFEARAVMLAGVQRTASLRMTDPIWAYALAVAVLGERLRFATVSGIALVLLGVRLLTARREARAADEAAAAEEPTAGAAGRPPAMDRGGRGTLYGLASAASYGAANVLRKAGMIAFPDAAFASLVSSAVGLSLAFLTGERLGDASSGHRADRRLSADYVLAGLASSAGLWCMFRALERSSVAVATAIRHTSPWMTMLLAPLIVRRREPLSARLLLASALLMAGILLVMTR